MTDPRSIRKREMLTRDQTDDWTSEAITLVEQPEPFKGDGNGSYVMSQYQIARPNEAYMRTAHPLSLSFWSYRPSKALVDMGFSTPTVRKIVRGGLINEDPFSGWKALHFVPSLVLTHSIEIYDLEKAQPWRNMVEDADYMRRLVYPHFFDDGHLEPSNIERGMMGSGYTVGTLPIDGHPEIAPAYMDLSNGDTLVGFQWVWYNK